MVWYRVASHVVGSWGNPRVAELEQGGALTDSDSSPAAVHLAGLEWAMGMGQWAIDTHYPVCGQF